MTWLGNVLRTIWQQFTDPEGRKGLAFLAILGGCMVFTVFAAVGVYLSRSQPGFSFLLALAAHVQVLIGLTAMGWVLGRQLKVEVNKDGVKTDDTAAIQSGDHVKVGKDA
jgi:pheromone shutdown protein TraB